MNVYIGGIKDYSAMRGPAPEGFHVPLITEWQGLKTIMDGLGLTTGDNWRINLHMPFVGYRGYSYADLVNQGSRGYYWSSSPYGVDYPDRASYFYLESSRVVAVAGLNRSYGFPVRCFKDSFEEPTSSWTVIQGTLGSAGIFWNQTEGLISITSDGTTGYTIQDKNLGATTVYLDGNTLSEANCGKYYQRGNNYGFAWTGSVTTSSTQVNAQNYGPGNYYSSSTFITGSDDWSSVHNDNLRGGVTGIVSPAELKNAYIGEYNRTFTISWTEKSDMSSGWTYSDDAAGLTAGSSEFDRFFGYYGCRLSSAGVETAKVNQSSPGTLDITQLGTLTSGDNVMIAFPRLGIKMSKSGTTVTLSITREPNKSGYQYYAHTKGSDSKDTLYLGAYEMVSGYKSLSGASPLGNLTRAGFRSGIKSTYDSLAGTNRYSQVTIYARWFVNALYMMKYGNPNSQSVVGNGYTYGSSTTTTGGTNIQTSATYGTSATNQQIKLFGLEDWRGNINEWLDCCYYNGSTHLTVDKTNSIFQDSAYSTDLGATSNGWLAGISGSNDGMFMNVNTSGGGGSAYYTDRFNAGANYVILTSGTYGSSNDIGVNFLTYTSSTLANAQLGGRLMYL